jgi:hypothetical protein
MAVYLHLPLIVAARGASWGPLMAFGTCMFPVAAVPFPVPCTVFLRVGLGAGVYACCLLSLPCLDPRRRYSLNGQGSDWVAPLRNMTSDTDNLFGETAFNNRTVRLLLWMIHMDHM